MKFNLIITLLLSVLFLSSEFALAQKEIQSSNLKSNFALDKNKNKYYSNLISSVESTLNTNIKENILKWNKAFKDAESILLNNGQIKDAIIKSLSLPVDKHLKLQRTTLEYGYTFHDNNLDISINNIFEKTKDKLSYAISVNYLVKSRYKNRPNIYYLNNLKNKFPNYYNISILKNLAFDLDNPAKLKFNSQPKLKSLFDHTFQKGKTIVYSIHRKNRIFPGITIVKKPDGNFVKNSDGTIFHIPQLAASYSNLPGYISNGNTPEGLYSIVGWYISPTETIGPTPNLLVRSPFEVSPEIFYHNKNNNSKWNIEDYKELLPKSWIDYFPIYQSFYAGKSGRRLIIIHGSTDETNYFKNQPYFPLTPTRGCLSSKEIWSSENGKCLESDQVKLINAYKSTGQKYGFLVVIEIDNKEKSVALEEIRPYLK